jgi:hypothetical protein
MAIGLRGPGADNALTHHSDNGSLITALVTLATTLLLTTHRTGVDVALVVSVAVIVGAGIFTALILEYPFSGSIAVSSAPLASATTGA